MRYRLEFDVVFKASNPRHCTIEVKVGQFVLVDTLEIAHIVAQILKTGGMIPIRVVDNYKQEDVLYFRS